MLFKSIFVRMQAVACMAICGVTTSLFAVTGHLEAKSKGKYGVIDMQAVILNVEEGKQARGELEKQIKEKEQEFLKKKKDLDKLNEDWKSQAALLSESARLKKQQEFQEQFFGLRNEEMTFQSEIKRKEQKATQKIAVKVAKLVEQMAEARSLEAVFETNTAGLLYLKDPVDLTKDVITEYEKSAKKDKSAPVAAKGDEKEGEKNAAPSDDKKPEASDKK